MAPFMFGGWIGLLIVVYSTIAIVGEGLDPPLQSRVMRIIIYFVGVLSAAYTLILCKISLSRMI